MTLEETQFQILENGRSNSWKSAFLVERLLWKTVTNKHLNRLADAPADSQMATATQSLFWLKTYRATLKSEETDWPQDLQGIRAVSQPKKKAKKVVEDDLYRLDAAPIIRMTLSRVWGCPAKVVCPLLHDLQPSITIALWVRRCATPAVNWKTDGDGYAVLYSTLNCIYETTVKKWTSENCVA